MRIKNKIGGFLILGTMLSCVEGTEFDVPKQACNLKLEPNISFAELEAMCQEEAIQIHEDVIIEGYVISSDKSGNFYNALLIQDKPNNPSAGIQLEIELRESHLSFKLGSKLFVKLKGLYLKKTGSIIELGGTFSSFGNISVGRLPTLKIKDHLYPSCEDLEPVEPTSTTLLELDSIGLNTLIRVDGMEVVDGEIGNTFATSGQETKRTLKDCEENTIVLFNSGFSDFQDEPLPQGNGTIIGILQKDKDEFQLIIRGSNDLDFSNERCPEIITEFTSAQFFISELADPDNNSKARFVELYNAAEEPLDLNKWSLRRYTNDKTEVSSTIDLSGFVVEPKNTLVISPNAVEFELVYGFSPDMGVSTNSPADSNGDDNLELVDPFGVVIDRFGVVGEDGSGTNHEFEDGRALRNANITEGNHIYTFEEWTIFNDTGDSGTTKLPQNAPEDFTPGVRQ
ncbi:DUF5689 domain-containing protein [Flagellimonas sp. S3867]|uniref:DUF5689 domain-containing protein n=1 Tax=Flagellimonas sp. S3867 TaxID=2768063 RepID=UPI001CC223AB|nr:DUF5689 domain-containing protein [Flagellimonas sp. S3867]